MELLQLSHEQTVLAVRLDGLHVVVASVLKIGRTSWCLGHDESACETLVYLFQVIILVFEHVTQLDDLPFHVDRLVIDVKLVLVHKVQRYVAQGFTALDRLLGLFRLHECLSTLAQTCARSTAHALVMQLLLGGAALFHEAQIVGYAGLTRHCDRQLAAVLLLLIILSSVYIGQARVALHILLEGFVRCLSAELAVFVPRLDHLHELIAAGVVACVMHDLGHPLQLRQVTMLVALPFPREARATAFFGLH